MAEYPQPESADPRARADKPSKQETLRRIRTMRNELSEKGKLLPKGI